MRAFERFSAGAALFMGGGCAWLSGDPSPQVEVETRTNDLHLNGLHLNGLHLNGLHLNGLHLGGPSVNGIHLNDATINGSYINQFTLVGGTLAAIGPDGVCFGGDDLAGARIAATLADGSPLTVRVDAISPSPSDDMLRYAVSYAAPGSDLFEPLCGAPSGEPVLAIPLSGAWDESEGTETGGGRVDDPSMITFACEGYVLAKCVGMGYAPWRRVTECHAPGVCWIRELTPFHQACTRMLRADYCGDGTSTTREGTAVDVWDALGLQVDEAPSWPFEAEWTTGGAACVMTTRWATLEGDGDAVASYIQAHCPHRWRPEGCGEPRSTFFAENGFALRPQRRVLLRSRVAGAM